MDLSGIDIAEPGKPRRRWPWLLLLVVLLAGLGIGLYRFGPFTSQGTLEGEALRPPFPAAPAQEAARPPAPVREAAPPPTPVAAKPKRPVPAPDPLPLLDASDPLVRELVGGLSRRPELARWLVSEELVRRFVASVDNIAEGQSPRSHIGFMRPEARFAVLEGPERVIVSPHAGERYDAITDVFVSIDARGAAQLYERLRPLIDEAWIELGYPDRDFDDTLEAAFDQLLVTPILQGPVELVPLVVTHAYADPRLEELAPAQKLLLRMGPGNQQRVQAKLRELAPALGMSMARIGETSCVSSTSGNTQDVNLLERTCGSSRSGSSNASIKWSNLRYGAVRNIHDVRGLPSLYFADSSGRFTRVRPYHRDGYAVIDEDFRNIFFLDSTDHDALTDIEGIDDTDRYSRQQMWLEENCSDDRYTNNKDLSGYAGRRVVGYTDGAPLVHRGLHMVLPSHLERIYEDAGIDLKKFIIYVGNNPDAFIGTAMNDIIAAVKLAVK